jgi:hypothetical protein
MALMTSCSVDPNRSPITLMACLMAVVIFVMCSCGVMDFSLLNNLPLRLEPMLQCMAVPTALRFIKLIGALGNPGLPINPLDRPWLAISVSGSRPIGCCALREGQSWLHGFFCKWQPHKVVTAGDRCQTQLAELAQPIDLIKKLVPCELGAIREQLLELASGVTRHGF